VEVLWKCCGSVVGVLWELYVVESCCCGGGVCCGGDVVVEVLYVVEVL